MNENIFKYLAIFFFVIVIWSFCSDSNERQDEYYDVNVQTMVPAAEGLDLKAVGGLLKKAETAEDLEQLLNSPAQGVNNLDLNADGKVDYINVTEYGTEKIKGFSLSTEPAAGEVQELATIEVEKTSDSQAQMQIQGNEQIYGRNHYHHSSFGLTDMLIMGYLFRPHGFWGSPYGYGRYPGYYSSYNTMSRSDYSNRTRTNTSGSSFRSSNSSNLSSTAKSPNAGKSAKSVKAPLRNPTSSQKSFQAKNKTSSRSRSGGFGRSSSSSRRSSSSRSGGFRSGK
ncbi:MAG: hypothetical protein D8M58_15930 [Calditrichaeota bacterium]|nr:MAG: hypothetical protein DWQ03_07660 [Calditrichota bacterium]MBL1206894.1 hypothetical protein [Calditrichota bacterium]NOG46720.1 hypothetical protein [Calditrichota bacterium]